MPPLSRITSLRFAAASRSRGKPLKFVLALIFSFLCGFISTSHGRLEWETRRVTLVPAPLQEEVTGTFTFRNNGEAAVRIERIRSTCGCMVVSTRKRNYAPTETGTLQLRLEFDPADGRVCKHAYVSTSTGKTVKLTLCAAPRPYLSLKPESLRWEVGSMARTRTVNVNVVHDEPICILDYRSTHPGFEIELRTIREGNTYRLAVTPVDTGKPVRSLLRLYTDFPSRDRGIVRTVPLMVRPYGNAPQEVNRIWGLLARLPAFAYIATAFAAAAIAAGAGMLAMHLRRKS